MSSDVKWTVAVGLVATGLATALVGLMIPISFLDLLGWAIFLELLQLPLISAARHGHIDPCTAWIRRTLSPSNGGA